MLAAAAAIVPASLAGACVAPVSLTVANPSVQPSGTVNVSFKEFAQGAPIEVHLDSPTGPLLATPIAEPGKPPALVLVKVDVKWGALRLDSVGQQAPHRLVVRSRGRRW